MGTLSFETEKVWFSSDLNVIFKINMEFYPTFVAIRHRKVTENFKFETERHTNVDMSVTYM